MPDHKELIEITPSSRFKLASHARLKQDSVRECMVLLLPEMVIKLNNTSAGILSLCDGLCTFEEMIARLKEQFQADEIENDVCDFLNEAATKGWIEPS